MSSQTTRTKTIAIGQGLKEPQLSLAPEAQVFGSGFEIRTKRVDVEAAAAVVAGINRQFVRAATRFDIEKQSLHAGLVKVVVLPERYDVSEQRFAIYCGSPVADHDAAHIRLIRNRTVAAQQVRL